MTDQPLAGRSAFVSGSSQGIGAATAHELARMGASVFVHGRDEDRVMAEVDSIRSEGYEADPVLGDLATDDDLPAILSQVRKAGREPEILVNVVGFAGVETWENSTAEIFAQQYQINTVSAVRMINVFVPPMRERGWGRVINISSIAGPRPLQDQVPAYAAAKASLLAVTASLAKTVVQDKVTVNCVVPGYVLTDALKAYFLSRPEYSGRSWEAIEPEIAEQMGIGLRRLGKPEEIARVIGFLAGPTGDWITGSNFRIDGGTLYAIT